MYLLSVIHICISKFPHKFARVFSYTTQICFIDYSDERKCHIHTTKTEIKD